MEETCLVENLVGAVAKESREDLGKISNYFPLWCAIKRGRRGAEHGHAITRPGEPIGVISFPRMPGTHYPVRHHSPACAIWNGSFSGMTLHASRWKDRKTPTH